MQYALLCLSFLFRFSIENPLKLHFLSFEYVKTYFLHNIIIITNVFYKVKPCFTILILPLVMKRTIIQRTSCEGTKFPVDVKLRLPSFYAFGIIHFRRSAEIIGNNAVRLIADKLCGGTERAFVEQPRGYVGFLCPLVQRHIAISNPASCLIFICLRDTATE